MAENKRFFELGDRTISPIKVPKIFYDILVCGGVPLTFSGSANAQKTQFLKVVYELFREKNPTLPAYEVVGKFLVVQSNDFKLSDYPNEPILEQLGLKKPIVAQPTPQPAVVPAVAQQPAVAETPANKSNEMETLLKAVLEKLKSKK